MKTYNVTIDTKHNYAGQRAEVKTIEAKNKAAACKEARTEAMRGGWNTKLDGALIITAVEA